MALAATKPKIVDGEDTLARPMVDPSAGGRPLDLAGEDTAHAPSPALALQSRLEGAFAPVADTEDHWSARRSIAFAVGSSLVLWTLIGLSVRALLH